MCYHEAIPNGNELTGYPHVGTADCGYALCDKWVDSIGEHGLVIIHRDPQEVSKSLDGIGIPDEIGYIPMLAEHLKKLKGLHVDFYDINARLEEIHDYLGIPGYTTERAGIFTNMNIKSMEWG